MKSSRVWVGIAAVAGVLAIAVLFVIGLSLTSQVGNRPRAGTPAPDFELGLYAGRDGGLSSPLRLANLRGQVVVLNFWASWCVPCRDEAPVLENAWREYRDRGVTVLGVGYLDTETNAEQFMAEFDITYPNGADIGQRISKQYRTTGVPETFVIDREGMIRSVFIAPVNEAQLRAAINDLLK
jgi:cytochrome c biogenesis protein CcmG/thiol:disulfide interchange protein DsbE